MKLGDLQIAFCNNMFSPTTSQLASKSMLTDRIRGGHLSPADRLSIYRHNVFSNLRGALSDLYPIIENVVGKAFFAAMADYFIRVTPSCSGDLNLFGAEFAAFIKAYTPASDLPYLVDVAKMEWAWHCAFHAADANALDLARLASVPAESHALLKFKLHPSAQLLASPFPLFDIWRVNQPEYEGDMQLDWKTAGDHLLVFRPDVEVEMRQLDAASFAFLSALCEGHTLEVAASNGFAVDEQFPLQTKLIEFVQMNLVVDFS
jgi:hypothetical protein